MKEVILIKYLPPTKTRGGRYRATYHGYGKCTVSANQSVLPRQNIAAAVDALLIKLGKSGTVYTLLEMGHLNDGRWGAVLHNDTT